MTRRYLGPIFIAPAMLLIFMLLYFPAGYGLFFSLFRIRFLKTSTFVGLRNYVHLLTDPTLLPAVARTAVFSASAVTLTILAGLLLAVWIDNLSGLLALATQIVVIVPWIISAVVASLLFRWVFVSDIGIGQYLLARLRLSFDPLGTGASAMILLILVTSWRTVGYALILILSGLKAIPKELYEAARVDGATGIQVFRRITVPLLQTPLLITVVVLTLSSLNNVETPLVTTGGGPGNATNVLPLYLYTQAFAKYDFATAIPLAICMFIANILLVLGYIRLVRWRA